MRILPLSVLLCGTLFAQESYDLDTMSVVGTKSEQRSSQVSQSVAVVDEEALENRNVMSINDALRTMAGVQAESKNGGYDSRLMIRGAGLKAPYGVREIMVLRDGVPMTDPDSFTRFDFIDVDDLARVEVLKGPGSLEGSGSAGGVVSLQSRSVFDKKSMLRLGFGNYNAQNHHLRVAEALGKNDFVAVTASYRRSDNDWRLHNNFSSLQGALKYGHIFEDESTLEAEISYTKADFQLPGSMNAAQFETFKETGEQNATQDAWQHSARNSDIFFANLRYERELAGFNYKPKLYFNNWSHFHPVTGAIGEKRAYVLGTEQTLEKSHTLLGLEGALVAGLSLRTDRTLNNKKYKYADLQYGPKFPSPFAPIVIKATLSDEKGELMEESSEINDLYGLYLSEELKPDDALRLNMNLRYDRSTFDVSGTEYSFYDYSAGDYDDNGSGAYDMRKSFDLFSAKLGATYRLSKSVNLFALAAMGDQIPTTSELVENPELKAARSMNYEVGAKVRTEELFLDVSVYQNLIKDEVVTQYVDGGYRVYANAGKTNKKGAELSVNYQAAAGLFLGGSYAYSDYKYDDYNDGGVEYSGNYLKYIPKHQYALTASYRHKNGFKAAVDSQSWGKYYTDDENTKTYAGYSFVTNLMLGYEEKGNALQLNVKNLFDQHYASEVKSSAWAEYYYAASPRTVMLSFRRAF